MKDLCLQDDTNFGDKAERLGEGQEVDFPQPLEGKQPCRKKEFIVMEIGLG